MKNIIILKCLVIRLLCLNTALIFMLIKPTVVVLLERTYFIGDAMGNMFILHLTATELG